MSGCPENVLAEKSSTESYKSFEHRNHLQRTVFPSFLIGKKKAELWKIRVIQFTLLVSKTGVPFPEEKAIHTWLIEKIFRQNPQITSSGRM